MRQSALILLVGIASYLRGLALSLSAPVVLSFSRLGRRRVTVVSVGLLPLLVHRDQILRRGPGEVVVQFAGGCGGQQDGSTVAPGVRCEA